MHLFFVARKEARWWNSEVASREFSEESRYIDGITVGVDNMSYLVTFVTV